LPEVGITALDGREIGSKEPSKYDRVLLDAPCTGLGALRRRPEARWRKSSEDLKALVDLQYELFESAYAALKPGGLLLYVTCSPHLSETTAVISKAVKSLGVEVMDLTTLLNNSYFKGSLPSGRKTVQLFTQRDGTDCMFMALIRK
jgi:16S rRNA (cytosine967-C5)-methyltransferase